MNRYDQLAYTYLIGWPSLRKWYYGYRCANRKSPEEDFWIEYFTSSPLVKQFIEFYGQPEFKEIDQTFPNGNEAHQHEIQTLMKLNAGKSNQFLNQYVWVSGGQMSDATRAKMSASHTGKSHPQKKKPPFSLTHRQNLSLSKTGIKNTLFGKSLSLERRKQMSETRKGVNNSFFGKHHNDETKRKISETKRLRKQHA
jgi:hypothetical protein